MSLSTPNKMPLGLFVAVDEEFCILEKRLTGLKKETVFNRPFYSGKLEGKDVVITKTGIGKVCGALTTTLLISKYGCDKIIFVGTAGALQPGLHIGDFVVGEKMVQHDCDQRPFMEPQIVPSLMKKYLETDPALSDLCYKACEKVIAENPVDNETKKSLNIPEKQTLLRGVLGTGDQFIHRPEQKKNILDFCPEMKLVAMEGAAIAQVCLDAKTPFAIVRVVSDDSNDQTGNDWITFCAKYGSVVLDRLAMQIIKDI